MSIRGATIAAAGFVLLSAWPASAQDTGLAGIHDWSRVGGKVCLKDHYHSGSSAGEKSRKAAELAAIGSWQGFTAWEYGGAWGSFRNAESKHVKCDGGGTTWGCNVEARPCRRR